MYPEAVTDSISLLEEEYGSLLDEVSILTPRPTITELSGGLTNKNLLIVNEHGKSVARISSNSSSLLSIDRESEFQNSKIAAEVGIAPQVLDYLPGRGLLVIKYIEGQTCTAHDVESNLDRIAASCRLLHSAKRFTRDFDMFEIQKNYLTIVQDRGFRLPSRYLDYQSKMAEMRRALSVMDEGTVPCNNDLLPGNFIDDGKQIWIIDYEYSGNNDACFELGNIWAESFLPLERLEELVTAYYGQSRPEKFARAWLFALAAKYGWTLWASIQDSVSTLEFDFWSWGMEKYDLAEKEFSGDMFSSMLQQVTQNKTGPL
jgi:thiamine kinase-like enzyme